ncbi:MAG: AMP-binding protein, partial [Mycobacterium sp.]
MLPVPAGADHGSRVSALRVGEAIDDDIAVVVTTSGTTGAPKGALLTAAALTTSAAATHDRLGGPGRWLLALPPYHIAGVQVLVRSLLAGTVPVELDVSTGFDAGQLPAAVTELGSARGYTALV